MKRLAASLALSLAALCAQAGEPFTAWVFHVADGDTITVLTADKQQVRVRLANIDAPEKGQAFGQACRQSLAAQVYQRDVTLRPIPGEDHDKYGRLVATVELAGADVNLAQLATGCAWHYTEFARRNQAAPEFARYAAAEQQARAGRIGLWADAHPIKPSLFRKTEQ